MENMSREQLKVVIVGHVDHGKSTLVGRIIHDSGSLPEGKLEHLREAAIRRGVPFEWANLMDSLQAERDQNITIDTTQIWFSSKKRHYVLIDAPGHKEFLKNMVTGAANAEAALLLVDAKEGVQEQSRRHGYLLNLLGIRQIAVAVNKMDLLGYDQEAFERIEKEYRKFLASLGLKPRFFVPLSAREGENIVRPSPRMPWWTGPSILDALDEFRSVPSAEGQPLRLVVQDVYHFDERRIVAGRIESGTLRAGDRIVFSPGNRVSTVKTIERWNSPAADSASAGESIGITLMDQLFISRGAIASAETNAPYELARIRARVFWMGRGRLLQGRSYRLKLATQEVDCEVEKIEKVIDASSLNAIDHADGQYVGRHEVADLTLHTRKAIAFDLDDHLAATRRFVIVDQFDVAGGGIILDGEYPHRTADGLHKSSNIYWTEEQVTSGQRTARNGHSGCVVWLTGLPAAGKSTISRALERRFFEEGKHVYILDGDKVRHGLCSDLGFSPEERHENIRRVGEMAKILADSGAIVITAFISPYRRDRGQVRQIMRGGHFMEVFLNAPLEVCERRDPKGLYQKARSGEIPDFTGISAPYEPPQHPEIELRTDRLSIEECVAAIAEGISRLK